jgi:hypothetical protein
MCLIVLIVFDKTAKKKTSDPVAIPNNGTWIELESTTRKEQFDSDSDDDDDNDNDAKNMPALPDHVFKWLIEQRYDETEIREFYAAWRALDVDGRGIARAAFETFVDTQFGDRKSGVDAARRERRAEIDWLARDASAGALYSFDDFLRYMDRFESVLVSSES